MESILLSLFKGYSDTCPAEATLERIVGLIRNDRAVADRTAQHRHYLQQQNQAAALREKASCPCFAVAVRFQGGKRKENICAFTSLTLADFDHIPPEKLAECLHLIRQDVHTLLAYTTISGNGIRILARCKPGHPGHSRKEQGAYLAAFEQMNRHYAGLIGQPYDEKCKNLTRLSGLAHDPEVYFNPEAEPFLPQQPAETDTHARTRRRTKRLQTVVETIARQLDEEGIAYEAHHRNEYIMRTGYLLNAYGIALEAATEWAAKQFADYNGDVPGILRSCYRNTDEHATRQLPTRSRQTRGRNGDGFATVSEIEDFLQASGAFRKNRITGKCEFRTEGMAGFADLTDRDVNTLWCRMCKEVKPARIADLRTVIGSDFATLYDPFRSYLEALPAWDGKTDHIARLAAQVHLTEGRELFEPFFKKWLVAMVASLLEEEVVNHEILVLIGRQGIYKTTWLNNLLPAELRRYFYLKTNSRRITKDDLLTLSEFAIVCLEELDEMDAQEVSQLKALTTMRHVNERAAYAHFKEMRPHIASFCGTSNNLHILTDLSGNRRWMPFEVECIDSPYDHPVDYAGVYAQAYTLLRQGFHYWLEEDEIAALNCHNRNFEVPCLERELILTHYRRPMPGETAIFVTTAQILARINFGIRQKLSPVKIGLVMKQEGFESLRYGGKRGYRVVELTGDEIYRNQQAMARYLTPPKGCLES